MRGVRPAGARCALVLLLAAPPKPAHAQSSQAPAVWYRASAECPTGLEFLGKISDWQQRARLAQAGDHIDFVVTLLSGSGETVGRLERQTDRGTVAIRELRDATCAQVAGALALSLGLALDPTRSEGVATEPVGPPMSDPSPAPALTVQPPPAPTSGPPAPPSVSFEAKAIAAPPERTDPHLASETRHPPHFGVDAGPLTGLGTQTMLRGSAFADFERVTHELSLRFALVGALGASPTPFGSVSRWLLAGRGELCPWRWGGAKLAVSPCTAFEIGVTSASVSMQSAQSPWAAPGLGLRSSLAVAPTVRLELGAGVLLPLVRGHIFYGTQPLYQDEIIAFQAALGVSLGQP